MIHHLLQAGRRSFRAGLKPLALATVMLTIAGTGNAQAAIYMDFDPHVEGSAVARDHDGWLPLDGASISVSVDATGAVGSSRDRTNVHVSDFEFDMALDRAYPSLLSIATTGDMLNKATIHFTSSGAESERTYFELLFEDVLLTSLTLNASGDGANVSGAFAFRTITATYTLFDHSGSKSGEVVGSYDVAAAAPLANFAEALALGLSGEPAITAVPLPAAAWLFAGAAGLLARHRRRAA
ncbi:MAG: type VI secretion system tube protein Hcp [Gammaproteobacteria bacterium]|nr:type VI secretion system tube protein Hcp [Gammaproteobacteria bacterium]